MRQHPRAVSHAGASTPPSHKRTAQKWGHPGGAILTPRFQAKICSGCHGLTIETRLTIEYYWDTTWVPTCLYLSGIFLINIFSPFQFFQKHNGFTTKCRVPVLKNPPWDSVISLQTAWPWKVPFSTKFLSSSMGPSIFFYKVTCHPKLKWAVDLFTRWPHYKMTHKNPFCSGLKATHFVWEIRRRMFTVSYNYNLPFMFLGLRNICRFGPLLKPPHLLTSAEKTLYRGQINLL